MTLDSKIAAKDASRLDTAMRRLPAAGGMIEVYQGANGTKGIDFCGPWALATEMLTAIGAGASSLYVCQDTEGGLVAIDAQVTAPVAAKMLAAAKQAGVSVRP